MPSFPVAPFLSSTAASRALIFGTLMALALPPAGLAAQQFQPQDRRIGNLQVRVQQEPYTLQGPSAQDIWNGLLSQPLGWLTLDWTYSWNYKTTGWGMGSCRIGEFELLAETRVTYPRWEAPEDGDPALLEAWAAFVADLEELWEAHLERERQLARQLQRRVEQIPEPCTAAAAAVRRNFDELRERGLRQTVAYGGGPELAWPPAGSAVQVDVNAAVQPTEAAAPSGLPRRRSGLFEYPDFPASFQDALSQDFGRPSVQQAAMVLAILRDGQVLGTQAAGTDPRTGDAPAEDAVFPFPALAEVLVAVVVNALEVNGVLDTTVPIRAYLPELPEAVGGATLEQLLGHRAGLQNGPLSLDGILADGDEVALFTEPGAVFSYSRHSYPLAVRAVEAVVGSPLEAILQAAVLSPFQLEQTQLGFQGVEPERLAPSVPDPNTALGAAIPADLPVIYTTIPDVARMVARFGRSESLGLDLDRALARAAAEGRTWVWSHGLWWTGDAGDRRALLLCGPRWTGVAPGLALVPEAGTGVVLWATDTWPHQTARWILDSAVRELDMERDPYPLPGPLELSSMEVESWTRCPYPTDVVGMAPRDVTGGEPLRDPVWAGTFFNGPDALGLVPGITGLVVEGSDPELAVRVLTDGRTLASDAEGRFVIPLELVRDAAGRRYLVIQGRAYLHEMDAVPAG